MKKILTIITVALIGLISNCCALSEPIEEHNADGFYEISVEYSKDYLPVVIKKIKYQDEGHSWIIFKINGEYENIVHDPNCQCHRVDTVYIKEEPKYSYGESSLFSDLNW